MASTREQVLNAMKAALDGVPGAAVDRNIDQPESIAGAGHIVLRDGDPGEGDRTLGANPSYYWRHLVDIEAYVQDKDQAARDAALDGLLADIETHLLADVTFGGVALTAEVENLEIEQFEDDGTATIKGALIVIAVEYETTTALG